MFAHQFKNPIYKEYYPHLGCDCYKIDLPYSRYAQHTKVLCTVSDGFDKARILAAGFLMKAINISLEVEENTND